MSAQSLELIRSILTLVALVLIIFLWSKLHSTFSFLENITLWEATSNTQGIEHIQPITLYYINFYFSISLLQHKWLETYQLY
ncbi:hypothetical protein [Candidatus Westeberhardia cardiocondylae]|uniref:hypothetical protein n=1 Tax=Candidatus Westeberhardia cardiocondylae TaxID=1594731 RepID=UPI003B969D26